MSSSFFLFLAVAMIDLQVNASPDHPHIVMIVIDDLGWNDVSYQGAEFSTPNIDRLAMSGVRLSHYYVNRVCSPTRSSLMAGRYAYNMGLDGSVIVNGQDYSLPLNHSTIADVLKTAGYATHAIGKWDLGMYRWSCTPTFRGFDTFFGYYNAFEDYFTHKCGSAFRQPGTNHTQVISGLDLRNNTGAVRNAGGEYSTHLFTGEAERLIMEHDISKPFFLYHAYQAVHTPLEAPESYIDMCNTSLRSDRRVLCGMMKAVDEGIGNITKRLEEKGMMNNTIIVFTTDNGGQNGAGGNNWPLRGNKATLFEGGVRGVGFLHGDILTSKGRVYDGLLHASDWFPTLAEGLAGLELNKSGSLQPLDGFNAWHAIAENGNSPRNEVLLTLDPPRKNFVGSAAIRVGEWKLILGLPNCSAKIWPTLNVSTDLCPTGWVHPSGIEIPPPANPSLTWLFNIVDDPLEKNNLHMEHPEIVSELRQRIEHYSASHINQAPPGVDPASNPDKFGGVWTPWQEN